MNRCYKCNKDWRFESFCWNVKAQWSALVCLCGNHSLHYYMSSTYMKVGMKPWHLEGKFYETKKQPEIVLLTKYFYFPTENLPSRYHGFIPTFTYACMYYVKGGPPRALFEIKFPYSDFFSAPTSRAPVPYKHGLMDSWAWREHFFLGLYGSEIFFLIVFQRLMP